MKIKQLIAAMLLMMCVVAGADAREIKLSPTHQGQSQTDINLGGGGGYVIPGAFKEVAWFKRQTACVRGGHTGGCRGRSYGIDPVTLCIIRFPACELG